MKIPQPLCENISSVGGWLAPTVPAPGGRQGNTGRGPNTGKENTLITSHHDSPANGQAVIFLTGLLEVLVVY